LYTHPPDGYSSVSIVDLAYFGYSPDELPRLHELPLSDRTPLLEAPWWPFDGMNEHGLAIGMAAVPSGNMAVDPQKRTIGSLEIMREVLDHASTVDEALDIFEDFNIDMRGGPDLHYLIADRSGRAILIEFYRGEMLLIENTDPWQLATNFLFSSINGSAEGKCWRYDTVLEEFTRLDGALPPETGMELLETVSQQNTQWSVIYGMSTGQVDLVVGQEYQQVYSFDLDLNGE
jgi:choloylglycine hydrolase